MFQSTPFSKYLQLRVEVEEALAQLLHLGDLGGKLHVVGEYVGRVGKYLV